MIYFIAIIYCLFLIYNYDFKNCKKGFKFHYYALLLLVTGIVGFSYRLGMDSIGYATYFERMDANLPYVLTHMADYQYEPVFIITNCIAKTIWNDFASLQLIVALFVNATIFWFLRKHSPMFFFSIFLYFIFSFWNLNFEIKRESIAISFFLIAIDQLLSHEVTLKTYTRYLLLCIPVFLSHRFGFLTLLFPLFFGLRLSRGFYIVTAIFFVISFLASTYLKELFVSFSGLLSYLGQDAVEDVAKSYISSDVYGVGGLSIIGLITGFIIPAIIIYYVGKNYNSKILAFSLLWLLVSILQSEIFVFYRITNYLYPFVFISFSCFLERIKKGELKGVLYTILILMVIFVQVYNKCHKTMYIRYYPYSSIFTKEINNEREDEFYRIDHYFNY